MLTRLLATTAAAGIASAALAGPLDRGMVPADAGMLVHVDLEALLNSGLTRIKVDGNRTILDEVREGIRDEIGADLTNDVYSVTLWSNDKEDEPVVLVSMSPAAEAQLRAMAMQEQVEFRRVGDLEFAEIDEGSLAAFIPGRHAGERFAIIGNSELQISEAAALTRARDRVVVNMDDSPLSKAPRNGSILYVSAAEMSEALKFEAVSLILNRTEGVLVDVGEHNGRLFMDINVTAPDQEEAQALNQMLAGGVGMAQFMAMQKPELKPVAKLVQNMRFSVNDTLISLSFDAETQTVIDALQAVQRTMENEGFDMGDVHDHAEEHHERIEKKAEKKSQGEEI